MTLSYVQVLELATFIENNSLCGLPFKCDSKVCNTKQDGVLVYDFITEPIEESKLRNFELNVFVITATAIRLCAFPVKVHYLNNTAFM